MESSLRARIALWVRSGPKWALGAQMRGQSSRQAGRQAGEQQATRRQQAASIAPLGRRCHGHATKNNNS